MGTSVLVQVTGFVGNDPQVRQVNDQLVASFNVAVSRKNRSGDKLTVWVRVNCWNKVAEIADQYVRKGSLVQVFAEWMRPQGWLDQGGKPQASIDIDAVRLVLLDRVGEHEDGNGAAAPDGNGHSSESVDDIPF